MFSGAIEILGPLAKTAFCPSVKLILDRFITHLLLLMVCNWLLLLPMLSVLLTCAKLLLFLLDWL